VPPALSCAEPLITAGNLSLDDTVNPDGEASGAPGGDALYSAVGAALWRCPVSAMSRVGTDYPREFLDRIAGFGIGIETLRVVAGASVHYRITNTPSGGREYEHLTPARRLHELSPQGADLDAVSRASWVHVAAMPLDLQEAVIARCRAKHVPYSLDPHEEYIVGHEARLGDLVPGSVFMPSELEVALMFPDLAGRQHPAAMAQTAANRLLDMGARMVAIKLGADGCFVANLDCQAALPALPVAVVDSTGAGDAFCGGFLAGHLQTDSLLVAAVCGTLSAAHVVRGFGAFHSGFPAPATLTEQAALLLRDAQGARAASAVLEAGFRWLGASPDGPLMAARAATEFGNGALDRREETTGHVRSTDHRRPV
jgi:sugar/nucleoside kinase (ribokinase family)